MIVRVLSALALLLAAAPALAWERTGHRTVAELAEQRLQPATRAAALALLAPEGARSLAAVASWADVVRRDPASRWSAPLHYVNMPDCRYEAARDCRDGACVIDAISRYRTVLADATQPAAQRAEALKYLIHFVGDVHQPFHATPHDDRGANQYQISLEGVGTNLHDVWDEVLVERIDIDALRARMQAAAPAGGDSRDPQEWALESCRLIDAQGLYPSGHTLDEAYLQRHQPLVEQRLLQAAERLRIELEAALGSDLP